MKFIVKPSPLPILIPLGPKYSPHDPVSPIIFYPIMFMKPGGRRPYTHVSIYLTFHTYYSLDI